MHTFHNFYKVASFFISGFLHVCVCHFNYVKTFRDSNMVGQSCLMTARNLVIVKIFLRFFLTPEAFADVGILFAVLISKNTFFLLCHVNET